MKRKKIFLTEIEIDFLKEAVRNILVDWEKDSYTSFENKRQVNSFMKKIDAL